MTSASGMVDEALARHAGFWRREAAHRPLVSMSRNWSVSTAQFDWGVLRSDGVLNPSDLDVGHFQPQYANQFDGRGPLDGDLFWPAMPPTAIPWLEAMLGCPIHQSISGGSISAMSPQWAQADDLREVADAVEWWPLDANPWFVKLLEFIDGIADVADEGSASRCR